MDYDSPREFVDIDVMEKAFQLLVAKVRQLNHQKIRIDGTSNLFWEIGLDEMFDVRNDRPMPEIGSIQDSFEFLANMVKDARGPDDAPPLMFMHMAAMMFFLAKNARY